MSTEQPQLPSRRRMLGLLGGLGAAPTMTAATAVTSCSKIPEETAGPYPGDGTNGPNVLTQSGVVRSDIRSSIGTGKGVATGVPLTIALTIVDSSGVVTFTSIFPAAYSGRWPHIHFEIFPSLASATNGQNRTAVSQLALPEDVCKAVFATTGYSKSATNMAQTSLKTDNVFSDGVSLQTPTVTGTTTAGYVAKLLVAV